MGTTAVALLPYQYLLQIFFMRKILRKYLQFLKRPNYNNKISAIPTRYSNVLGAKGGSCGM